MEGTLRVHILIEALFDEGNSVHMIDRNPFDLAQHAH